MLGRSGGAASDLDQALPEYVAFAGAGMAKLDLYQTENEGPGAKSQLTSLRFT